MCITNTSNILVTKAALTRVTVFDNTKKNTDVEEKISPTPF